MKFKMLCFDMDGVIFKTDNFWLQLHKALGTYEKGKELTEKYLYHDYARLVKEVMKLWKDKDAEPYWKLVKKMRYTAGTKPAMKKLKDKGYKTAIISSGPYDLAVRAQDDFGINFIFTNRLVIDEKTNKIKGFKWPIGTTDKANALRYVCRMEKVKPKEVISVCDDLNDVEKANISGFGIAFNSGSKELIDACDVHIQKPDLKEILRYC
ncbi:HAD-IB family phosphatase [Candidatus Woesearchaeota archaeon]|nr:HAD-IB family phosphatase [Candidatus Woesearchaeota archaeon]